jgi:hypothetical protein
VSDTDLTRVLTSMCDDLAALRADMDVSRGKMVIVFRAVDGQQCTWRRETELTAGVGGASGAPVAVGVYWRHV